jgi:hypothetical protein
MSDETPKPKPKLEIVPPPSDALDLSDLWLDNSLGDPLTSTYQHSIPVGKPKDFFRVHPDRNMRRHVEIYVHKPEEAVEEQHFIVNKSMQGRLLEARPAVLVVCIYRDGSLRVWPLDWQRKGRRTTMRGKARAMLPVRQCQRGYGLSGHVAPTKFAKHSRATHPIRT